MKKSGVKEFENKRWKGGNQAFVFRHAATFEMVEKGQKVLDIACGDGLLLSVLSQKGAVVSGVDISEEGVRKCKEKGFDVSVADISLSPLPFHDSTFDAIIMLDILEHLYSPEDLLREAIRISKKYIIVSVPNFNSFPARLQVLFGKVPENNRPNKGHLYWFNYSNLFEMFERNNLHVLELRTNTFFESKFLLGGIMRFFSRIFPSLFALSFSVKLEK